LKQPNVRRLVDYVYELVGESVPLKTVERSLGTAADQPVVQEWIDTLLAGEWKETDGQ